MREYIIKSSLIFQICFAIMQSVMIFQLPSMETISTRKLRNKEIRRIQLFQGQLKAEFPF